MIDSRTVIWSKNQDWTELKPPSQQKHDQQHASDLLLVWGPYQDLINSEIHTEIRSQFPDALILGCATPGSIFGPMLLEDQVIVSKLHFEHTQLKQISLSFPGTGDCRQMGHDLAQSLSAPDLQYVMLLIADPEINHSQFLAGMNSGLPAETIISGGLSGLDENTSLLLNSEGVHHKMVTAIGFYGSSLHVSSSTGGGWDPFGPERIITRSENNIIYEMDHQPALDLYSRYLGDLSIISPTAYLDFPLELETPDKELVVRTVTCASETERSLSFGGDMPENSKVRLMKYNPNRLIDGAGEAARSSLESFPALPQLALLISCVGRKQVLCQRTEEELEEAQSILGQKIPISGFYSGGEIATTKPGLPSQLHNETMSITLMSED